MLLLGDTLPAGLEMVPVLVQSLEKAGNQPTQFTLVTEAVSAANLLVKLSLVDINEGNIFLSSITAKIKKTNSFGYCFVCWLCV